MYQRILVPVDGSSASMLGLNEAIGLTADQHARLRILNVVDELAIVPAAFAYPAGDASDLVDSLRVSGKEALEEAAARAAKRGVEVERAQIEGHLHAVSDVILGEARKWRADLLVMGTHGRRGINRLILGSDAERVLRDSPIPVLLVRGHEVRSRAAKALRKTRTRRRSRAR